MRKTELLSPAGTMDSVISAINGGADAIYLGGGDFNARSSNENFSNEQIKEVVSLCALYNVKVYLTVNTLIKDSELDRLIEFLDFAYEAGVYAFIIQDVGLIDIIKTRYKDVKLHASTQMSAHSMLDVLYLKNLGFDRVVLARETSLLEIKTIKDSVDIELEVFVHGALCVSYSGQCLMSSLIGGRSGNRGKCAQPCRKKLALYDTVNNEKIMDGFLLSPKDMKQTENIDKLIEIGVDSLKIEGRMKSPEYVYQTTKIYSDKIDSVYNNTDFDEKDASKRLLGVFNRGGRHSFGYANTHSIKDLMSIETPKSTGTYVGKVTDYNKVTGKCVIKLSDDLVCGDGIEIWTSKIPHVGTNISKEGKKDTNMQINIEGEIKVGDKVYKSYNKKLMDELKSTYKKITRKNDIEATFEAVTGKPFNFSVKYDDIVVSKNSVIVTKTDEKPLVYDVVAQKLCKSGNTPFTVNITEYKLDDNAFLPLKNINELKREVLEELEEKIKLSTSRQINDTKINKAFDDSIVYKEKSFSVQLEDLEKLDEVLQCDFLKLYLPYNNNLLSNIDTIIEKCKKNVKDLYIVLPKITSTDTEILIDDDINMLKEKGVNGFVVSNYGQILMCHGSDIILDYNFNLINNKSIDKLLQIDDVIGATISPECTLDEIKSIETNETEVIIHGRQVVMETRACPIGIYIADKKGDKFCSRRNQTKNYVFRDKMNVDFPIKTNCDTCICQIYNGNTLFLMDKYDDIKKLKSTLRINISNESNPAQIINGYINSINFDNTKDVYDIKDTFGDNITKGHFYRGVL